MKTNVKVSRFFTHFTVSGVTYYDAYEVMGKLKTGSKCKLVPEPDNRYDPHAVAIYYNNSQLGYIPKSHNKEISRIMLMGYDIFEAFINRITPEEYPENQLGVVVKIKELK